MDRIRQEALRLLYSDQEFKDLIIGSYLDNASREDLIVWSNMAWKKILVGWDNGFEKFNIGDEVITENFVRRGERFHCTCDVLENRVAPRCMEPTARFIVVPDFMGQSAHNLPDHLRASQVGRSIGHVTAFQQAGMTVCFPNNHKSNFLHSHQVLILKDVPQEDRWWERAEV